jgi:hypothetical protein
MKRLQILVDEAELEQFKGQAEVEGLSLSAWLRRAGHAWLLAHGRPRITTLRGLKAFFRSIDVREEGREPDWDEHKETIARSQASGRAVGRA